MKKIIALSLLGTLTISSSALALESKQDKLIEYTQQISKKFEQQNEDISKYFDDFDFSLKQKLINRDIIRPEIFDKLPADTPLTHQQFFTLYLEFKIGDKYLSQPETAPFKDIPVDHEFVKQAEYLKKNDIYTGHLGYFNPDDTMTTEEMKTLLPGVEDIYTSDQDTALTLGLALDYLYRLFNIQFESDSTYSTPVNLKLDENYFYNGDKKIQGLFVHWHTIDTDYSDKDIREELRKMKSFGIIGVSTEIPWKNIEVFDGQYEFPRIPESILTIAQEEGMWVTLLLSPHYTPEWAYNKYDKQAKLHNEKGEAVDKSGFLAFSTHGPLVNDQIEFQKAAIEHYSKYDNVLAFFLSNEPGFDHDSLGDYSQYALDDWDKWCKKYSLKSCEVPHKKDHPNYQNWMRFQQQSTIDYLNRVYLETKPALDHFIPLSHKIVPYFLPDQEVANVGLSITPSTLEWDFIGADTYGFIPHIYEKLKSFKKPILIAETNFHDGWNRNEFYRFLLYQYLQGATIQTIYKWEYNSDQHSLFSANGKLNENARALIKTNYAIDLLKDEITIKTADIALLVPLYFMETEPIDHQSNFEQFTSKFLDTEMNTNFLWSNDLAPQAYHSDYSTPVAILDSYKKIYLYPTPLKKLAQDLSSLENKNLWEWVEQGGELILPNELTPTNNNDNSVNYGTGKIKFCDFTDKSC